MIATQLWLWLRGLVYKDLGRARRYLVTSVLVIALLGTLTVWAKPKLDAWLHPPPRPMAGSCSNVGVVVNPTYINVDELKQWVGLEGKSLDYKYVWNGDKQRLEVWFVGGDKNKVWQVEVVCYYKNADGKPYPVYGEIEVWDIQKLIDYEKGKAEAGS